MPSDFRALTPSLKWLFDMMSFIQSDTIKIPSEYRKQVLEVKKLLNDDPSGLTCSLLDYAINCSLVDYRIEVEDNEELEKILNTWLENVNSNWLGRVPTGLESLAKEYFRERWKGSSNILLRTFWEDSDSLKLPTALYFIDGEDIKVKTNSKVVELGKEKYYIRVNDNERDDIALPRTKDELIFIQRPFESWGVREPIPYLIKRGIYRNSMFLQLMTSKGEHIVGKALEYMLLLKKGTERLALEGNTTYDGEDLKKINQELVDIINKKKSEQGFASYTTNFDTDIQHLIPEYTKAVNDALYSPIEKRILAGLGLVEIVEGVGSTRRESILNPKPFIGEIYQGIKDFRTLLSDIVKTVIRLNADAHPKWMNAEIRVMSSPVQAFMDDKFRTLLRSMYDRGALSKQTLVELAGELDFDLEVERRKKEKADGLEDIMFAPVIQNQGMQDTVNTPDKTGPEKKNFTKATLAKKFECSNCNHEFESDIESSDSIACPECNTAVDILEDSAQKIFEQAPYSTNKDLPEQVKALPTHAKTIFRKAFNNALQQYGDETTAFRVARSAVKVMYKKDGEKWVRKSKGEFEESMKSLGLEKQNKLLEE